MKNIKFPILIVVQLFVFQLVTGQNQVSQTDENGRLLGTTPAKVTQAEEGVQRAVDDPDLIDDADIPGDYFLRGGEGDDTFIGEQRAPSTLMARLDDMEAELEQLRLYNEQLANENQTMKMEMANCCSEAASNLNIAESYLMQNSPNPFQSNTKIQFFISESAMDAKLELRDMDGVLLDTFDLDQTGIGELQIDRNAFNKGSYVYTLSVDGKIIDSKVMILQ